MGQQSRVDDRTIVVVVVVVMVVIAKGVSRIAYLVSRISRDPTLTDLISR